MAFMISRSQPSFSDAGNVDHKHNQPPAPPIITTHLQLKSSPESKTMDKQVVLKRIRQHRSINNIKSAFQALLSSSEHPKMASNYQPKCREHQDVFSP